MNEKQEGIPGSIKIFILSFAILILIGPIENEQLMGLQIGIGLVCFISIIYMCMENALGNG